MTDSPLPADWAIERAAQLSGSPTNIGVVKRNPYSWPTLVAFARHIEQHETPPVDPDVVAVREILAAVYRTTKIPSMWRAAQDYSAGKFDRSEEFRAALAAYRASIAK